MNLKSLLPGDSPHNWELSYLPFSELKSVDLDPWMVPCRSELALSARNALSSDQFIIFNKLISKLISQCIVFKWTSFRFTL